MSDAFAEWWLSLPTDERERLENLVNDYATYLAMLLPDEGDPSFLLAAASSLGWLLFEAFGNELPPTFNLN